MAAFCMQYLLDIDIINNNPKGWYSETTNLRPLFFFGHLAKTAIHFLVKKPSLIRPNIFGPLVTVLREFHCIIRTAAQLRQKQVKK